MTIGTCQICNNDFAAAGTDKVCNSCVDGWTQAAPVAENVAHVIEERFAGLDSEQARQVMEALNGTSKVV